VFNLDCVFSLSSLFSSPNVLWTFSKHVVDVHACCIDDIVVNAAPIMLALRAQNCGSSIIAGGCCRRALPVAGVAGVAMIIGLQHCSTPSGAQFHPQLHGCWLIPH
jgi:hypothetical protein